MGTDGDEQKDTLRKVIQPHVTAFQGQLPAAYHTPNQPVAPHEPSVKERVGQVCANLWRVVSENALVRKIAQRSNENARPAIESGDAGAQGTAQPTQAQSNALTSDSSLSGLLVKEGFWRVAWGVSLVCALSVLLGAWYWWDSIVQMWPPAGRLH
ncbi:hypothetical protein HK14_11950 [Acetobacter cibinongensis]|uniref:Uncharacterized protein n=1 Tax=Acetobacter cibinongensis TaxID=146475 RepID=A0A1Z5YSI6_9PROT|nr:hypothetical protein HK14_11950 [Acetobacter cibinongensis]